MRVTWGDFARLNSKGQRRSVVFGNGIRFVWQNAPDAGEATKGAGGVQSRCGSRRDIPTAGQVCDREYAGVRVATLVDLVLHSAQGGGWGGWATS